MSVIFKAEDHSYKSSDPNEEIKWTSVTSFISKFKEKFDAEAQAVRSSKNKKSKWYGLTPEEIQNHWSSEANRAVTLGGWYHDQREQDLISHDTLDRQGISVPIFKPLIEGESKVSPEQRLVEGIYPEHFVYLKSAAICGQADRIEVVKNVVSVYDYKTNKEIKKESYRNWEGIPKMMSGPCAHLEDCNFNHYALQLSMYLYIILKHNPRYNPGKLELQHVTFEVEKYNEFGNPIHKLVNNEPVIKEIVNYELPYLKNEVRAMIQWGIENKNEKSKS